MQKYVQSVHSPNELHATRVRQSDGTRGLIPCLPSIQFQAAHWSWYHHTPRQYQDSHAASVAIEHLGLLKRIGMSREQERAGELADRKIAWEDGGGMRKAGIWFSSIARPSSWSSGFWYSSTSLPSCWKHDLHQYQTPHGEYARRMLLLQSQKAGPSATISDVSAWHLKANLEAHSGCTSDVSSTPCLDGDLKGRGTSGGDGDGEASPGSALRGSSFLLEATHPVSAPRIAHRIKPHDTCGPRYRHPQSRAVGCCS